MKGFKPTRFAELVYRYDGHQLWRVYDATDGSPRAVGPHYRSQLELLADLPRYAREWGCEGAV